MRQFLNSFTWAFLLVFSVPSVLIVASWNSLPNESLYTVKLGLEQSLLFIASPSVQAKESLQVRYTERRLSDAKRMLSEKHSVDGLPYLTYQINATRDTLVNAPKGETQKQLAQKYIATLENASSELEEQKQSMTIATQTTTEPGQTVAPPTSAPKAAATPTLRQSSGQAPTPAPTVAASVTVTSQVPPGAAATALQITKTQETIKKTIDDLKKITGEENGNKDQNKDSDSNSPERGPSAKNKGKD